MGGKVSLEAKIAKKFDAMSERLRPGCILSWEKFRDAFILPMVFEYGARTYELLSGKETDVSILASARSFLDGFDPAVRGEIRKTIIEFMNSSDIDIRTYVLRSLNAYFLVQACNLPESTIKRISDPKNKLNLKVFVDTNSLFSLLGLHENPSDDAAESLRDLIANLSGRVNIKLYALPITVDETRRTLIGYENRLSGIILTPHLSKAIVEGTHDLSGIALKYVKDGAKALGRFTAKEYFAPYHENLVDVMRGKGVELYNAERVQ